MIRCQGVVLQDDCILLVKHANHLNGNVFWGLPGGGVHDGESRQECVQREIREETGLEVSVERLLFETEDPSRTYTYRYYNTFLCRPRPGSLLRVGKEQSPSHEIIAVGWFSLWNERAWEAGFAEDHIYSYLKQAQAALRPPEL